MNSYVTFLFPFFLFFRNNCVQNCMSLFELSTAIGLHVIYILFHYSYLIIQRMLLGTWSYAWKETTRRSSSLRQSHSLFVMITHLLLHIAMSLMMKTLYAWQLPRLSVIFRTKELLIILILKFKQRNPRPSNCSFTLWYNFHPCVKTFAFNFSHSFFQLLNIKFFKARNLSIFVKMDILREITNAIITKEKITVNFIT